ncbi:hypothetical protein C943_01917 [Mariniradius saccharolyticus AK6]|uniref:Transmembrane protein n=1 Tax=Mariniradius saccharolyticus AK6 TaxID=1239962 RepID=M7Y346_9BACT|nr:hypothetical protein C943_01917 [Mariniradius saccharolyticus AK6]
MQSPVPHAPLLQPEVFPVVVEHVPHPAIIYFHGGLPLVVLGLVFVF